MIAFLHGEIAGITDNSVYVSCAGVGYEALMSATDLAELPQVGETVTIYTYLNVNENTGVSLFGFINADDLRMFKLLITVSGIGPKGALAVLSVLPSRQLTRAIFVGDEKAITKAPGIGAKAAAKIILELKDKIQPEELTEEPSAKPGNSGVPDAVLNEAIVGLTTLGYTRKDAEKAVAKAAKEGMNAEDILNGAFRYL